jgi:electron transfer flavoprotein beta subunit
MKILVAVKRVIDANVRVRLLPDGTVDTVGVKYAINPFDEIALEQAIRFREAGIAEQVIAVSVGTETSRETLRATLALGADRAILVTAPGAVEPLAVAKVLVALAARTEPGLILLGKQAIDDDCSQTGQMLSALLGWPQATAASEIIVDGEAMMVTRETDDGLETLHLTLPAVVTVDLRLNTPRFVTLPNIMKAKSKPMDILDIADLGVDATPRLKTLSVTPPRVRAAGQTVTSVDDLIHKLRTVARVLP